MVSAFAPGPRGPDYRVRTDQIQMARGSDWTAPGRTAMLPPMLTLFSAGSGGAVSLGADPLTILLLALVLDAYLGEMGLLFRLLPHPVVAMGARIGALDRRLNKTGRSPRDLRLRGVVTVLILVAGSIGVGLVVQALSAMVPLGWLLELFLATALIAQRSLYDHVEAVAKGLGLRGLAGGREAVRHIVGRDPQTLDQYGVARAAIESCAENFADGVVGPVFWYLVFGLPGLLACKMINTMDSMIGHRTDRYRYFGWAAARLDDMVMVLPARLSALLLVLAAMAPGWAHPREAVATIARDSRKHRSPNAGWPEAAMAGALRLRLSGPRTYHGEASREEPWVGNGRAEATPKDIRRALRLMRDACLIQGILIALLAVVTKYVF